MIKLITDTASLFTPEEAKSLGFISNPLIINIVHSVKGQTIIRRDQKRTFAYQFSAFIRKDNGRYRRKY